eukprot:3376708-Prymnesium_polylepis.1
MPGDTADVRARPNVRASSRRARVQVCGALVRVPVVLARHARGAWREQLCRRAARRGGHVSWVYRLELDNESTAMKYTASLYWACLLYTSDAADDMQRVDLG